MAMSSGKPASTLQAAAPAPPAPPPSPVSSDGVVVKPCDEPGSSGPSSEVGTEADGASPLERTFGQWLENFEEASGASEVVSCFRQGPLSAHAANLLAKACEALLPAAMNLADAVVAVGEVQHALRFVVKTSLEWCAPRRRGKRRGGVVVTNVSRLAAHTT